MAGVVDRAKVYGAAQHAQLVAEDMAMRSRRFRADSTLYARAQAGAPRFR